MSCLFYGQNLSIDIQYTICYHLGAKEGEKMKGKIAVQCRLSRLLLTCSEDIITKADGIKLIPNFKTLEGGGVECGYEVEVTNPVDYTKEQFKKLYNGNKMISEWSHTIENGIEKLVIVIK